MLWYNRIMKKCNQCGDQKPFSEFNKKGNGYQHNCRKCQREWYKNYYTNSPTEKERLFAKNKELKIFNRKMVQELKEIPCMDCGVSYPYYVMDFDHRDPNTKNREVALMLTWSTATLLQEIEKCDIVCANCHRIRTHATNS